MQFKIDTKTPPPAPRGKFTPIEALIKALTEMPVGASIPIKTADVDLKTVRAHTGKVTRENAGTHAFVMRSDDENGLTRVWRVEKVATTAPAA